MRISAIVAASDNNCIGINNDLPWHIPADLKFFKDTTSGKPVIMGRKTFESIFARLKKPLPGRHNIILSRSGHDQGFGNFENLSYATDVESALLMAKSKARDMNTDEIIIGGGAQIYQTFMPYIDRLYLTRVHQNYDGDAFLPEAFFDNWSEVQRETYEAAENTPSFSFVTLER